VLDFLSLAVTMVRRTYGFDAPKGGRFGRVMMLVGVGNGLGARASIRFLYAPPTASRGSPPQHSLRGSVR
jgi:hypothetical protein